LRQVDQATVAGYYGSDSAGTFMACLGALGAAHIAFAGFMPVLLAVMEIPGCLVAVLLVSRLRQKGMDPAGNMPDEPGYDPHARPAAGAHESGAGDGAAHGKVADGVTPAAAADAPNKGGLFKKELLHEVFLNPGIFLMLGGIVIGFVSGVQGLEVTQANDPFFVSLFQGALCLYLFDKGLTAASHLGDLAHAGKGFILFGVLAPNLFATIGICAIHGYSFALHRPLDLGTYVLFGVNCAAASYIALPAVQRLAIPEASPSLPLAASLGLTFTYNVTIGIPLYILIATAVTKGFPIM
jgi:hypothetical protein